MTFFDGPEKTAKPKKNRQAQEMHRNSGETNTISPWFLLLEMIIFASYKFIRNHDSSTSFGDGSEFFGRYRMMMTPYL